MVDEEIYRRLPALLIATVDKFAQMPWKGETQMLFGKVNGCCQRHGYRSPEIEDTDTHRATDKHPAAQTVPAGPLRPPDLIIQDELHLISGPLGTLVGLYETAIDHLCTWEANGQKVRPKVIASTATIRRANYQVNQLYLRKVAVFPPPGLDHTDNFFARQRPPTEALPGRRYVGICAPGTRLKTILIRVYVACMAAAQQLYEQEGQAVDPYMTLVGYFNSMRELGGMRRVVDDAVRTRLQKADLRGLAKRFIEHFTVEELTSRKGPVDIPQILTRLETPFLSGEKKQKPYPLDVLLATNMISVGVDVNRLGLMVTAGQPKTTAEYIQATSRVGRYFPGLVCTVYNWTRPRDLSHYERFEHYHATFYQNVEPLSVTPFSARALDRGLTGVLVAAVSGSSLRRTDQALLQVINASQKELLIVSFAVYKIPKICNALVAAAGRGVNIAICLEAPDPSEGKITFDTIKALGTRVAQNAAVYIWPEAKRPCNEQGKHGSLHVKCAVADRRHLFISSANLTEYALTLNMELGVLIEGGDLPETVADHFSRLIEDGLLAPV